MFKLLFSRAAVAQSQGRVLGARCMSAVGDRGDGGNHIMASANERMELERIFEDSVAVKLNPPTTVTMLNYEKMSEIEEEARVAERNLDESNFAEIMGYRVPLFPKFSVNPIDMQAQGLLEARYMHLKGSVRDLESLLYEEDVDTNESVESAGSEESLGDAIEGKASKVDAGRNILVPTVKQVDASTQIKMFLNKKSHQQSNRRAAPKRRLRPNRLILTGKEIHPFNPWLLSRFVTKTGRIMPRKATGLSTKQQRKLAKAIRKSRQLGLMAYTEQFVLGPLGNTYNEVFDDDAKSHPLLPPLTFVYSDKLNKDISSDKDEQQKNHQVEDSRPVM